MFVCLILPVSSVSPAPWSHSLIPSSKLRDSFGISSGRALVSFFWQCKVTTFANVVSTFLYVACDCLRLRAIESFKFWVFDFLMVLSVELIHSSLNNSTSASPTIPHSTLNIPHCQRQPFHIPHSTLLTVPPNAPPQLPLPVARAT